MSSVNALLESVLAKILGDPAEATAYSEDPSGYLAAAGVADADLEQADLGQVVSSVSNELNIAPETT